MKGNQKSGKLVNIRRLPQTERNRLYREAIRLQKEFGIGDTRIAREFNISRSTVQAWLRNYRYDISYSKGFSFRKRVNLYKKVITLYKKFGWGSRIISRVLKLPQSTVKQWIHKKCKPKEIGRFKLNKSKELSYVIGVAFGDASSYKSGQNYYIELKAKDKDFVKRFNYCLSKVLNRNNYSISRQRGLFRVIGCNKSLYKFLEGGLEALKPFIEANPEEFIRGLADSEGSVNVHIHKDKRRDKEYLCVRITIDNTNLELLRYVQNLLDLKFNIFSFIYLITEAGSQKAKRGYGTKQNVYELLIERFDDVKRFKKAIGFSIKRKREKLADVIRVIEKYGSHEAVKVWKSIYKKSKRGWVKIIRYINGHPSL